MGLMDSFSARGKAKSLYKRGMKNAKDRKYDDAISDYNAVLNMPKAPPELKAMALFNRALTYSSTKEFDKAQVDLDKVLELPNLPSDIREAARQKLERMRKRLASPDAPE